MEMGVCARLISEMSYAGASRQVAGDCGEQRKAFAFPFCQKQGLSFGACTPAPACFCSHSLLSSLD